MNEQIFILFFRIFPIIQQQTVLKSENDEQAKK